VEVDGVGDRHMHLRDDVVEVERRWLDAGCDGHRCGTCDVGCGTVGAIGVLDALVLDATDVVGGDRGAGTGGDGDVVGYDAIGVRARSTSPAAIVKLSPTATVLGVARSSEPRNVP